MRGFILMALAALIVSSSVQYAYSSDSKRPLSPHALSDDEFLQMIEDDTIIYFLKEINPKNGLVRDSSKPYSPSSIAACGFSLAVLPIACERDIISKDKAYKQALMLLETAQALPNENGFFYHFISMYDGERVWSSEVSSIDTAIFLSGALLCGEYFKGTEVETIAKELYERVNWQWMLNDAQVLSMGWKPEEGFLPYSWDSYNELLLLYALAIGSPTYPIPKESWNAWERPVGNYGDYEFVYSYSGSLFTYQYPHAFIDFKNLYDGDINYWENSYKASLANRKFCIDNKDEYVTYGEDSWGLSASLGPQGYKAYGATPGKGYHDGTISPSAIAGSIIFVPDLSIKALRNIYDNHGDFIYGRYGFRGAFNLDKKWFADEYLGVDQGVTVLMIENYRTAFVWKLFMKLEPIKKWIALCLEDKGGDTSYSYNR